MEPLRCSTAPGQVFNSREELHVHYQSDLHRYNLRRKAAGLAPITDEVFQRMKRAMEQRELMQKLEQTNKKLDHVKISKRDVVAAEKKIMEQQEHNEDEVEEEEEEEEDIDLEELKKPVDLNKSFFDDHISKDLEGNLEYMRRQYGFMIPDRDAVINLEGLVKYTAQKIAVGRLCLYCEKGFKSREACVQHMLDVGHCKICWEYDTNVEEFSDYYDFSAQEAKAGKKSMEITESGEYIFRDGNQIRRVGVRQFSVYYKQRFSVQKEKKPAVLANGKEELMRLYKSSGVDQNQALSIVELREEAARRHPMTKKLVKERKARMFEYHKRDLAAGISQNLLMKNDIAGTNMGAGHGVHG